MYYRFHLNVPAGTLIRTASINAPAVDGTFATEAGFLSAPPFGPMPFDSFVNGNGAALGLVAGTFETLLAVGADNLIAVLVPDIYAAPVPIATGRWASFVFHLAYKGAAVTGVVATSIGRSSAQIIG
jgi:hypothetical protein